MLHRCEPVSFLHLPRPVRVALGWITLVLFSLSFYSIPLIIIFTVYAFVVASAVPWVGLLVVYGAVVVSFLLPTAEIAAVRNLGQLWYEIFDFSSNLDEATRNEYINLGKTNQYILGMHPHGIIPIQAVLWASYCHQYMVNESNALYGFGAAADVVAYVPFLRNLMIWLSSTGAGYQQLKNGLAGKVECCNNAGRIPRHLFLLPGGIAEVFTSTPGKNIIVFSNRKGLCRLSLETGAHLIPMYVFGGTDFFVNLATGDGIVSKFSRWLRAGLTIFWGQYMLPIPYTPRVSMCLGRPILIKRWSGEGPVPDELVDDLHKKYIQAIQDLFETHKVEAGHADSHLEVR